jgi:predicted PurR-regulated permease PerM
MDKNVFRLDVSLYTILKIIGILLFVYFLFLIRDVLVLLVISFILAAALEPAVDKMQRKLKFPRWLGALSIYSLFIAVIYVFASIVVPILNEQFQTLITNKDIYIDDIQSTLSSLPQGYKDPINNFINDVPSEIKNWQLGGISHRVSGVFSGIASFFVVIVISVYILSLKNGMKQTISAFVPEKRRKLFIKIFGDITRKMSLWFRGQMLLSLSIGVVTYIGLSIMHVPYALVLAMIAAFFELIPMIGPVLGAIPAVLVALFISPIMALIVGAFYVFVQQLENHILVPQVMKKAVGLNPVIIISAMLIGAKLLGILGVILAVPIASSISVILKEWPKSNNKEVTSGN